MKCRYRITLPSGDKTPILEMPEEDFWAGHMSLLEAMGITDSAHVTSESQALQIAKRASEQWDSAARAAGKSGSIGRKSRR